MENTPRERSTDKRGKRQNAIFFALIAIYISALAGMIYIATVYDQYLGTASTVQRWLDNNATAYSIDLYGNLITIRELGGFYYRARADKTLPLQNIIDQSAMFRAKLNSFEPGTPAGHVVSQLPASVAAFKLANQFVSLIEEWAKSTHDRAASREIEELEDQSYMAMSKLSLEAQDQEFLASDEMKRTILSSRSLAKIASVVAGVLYLFGAIALARVFFGNRAWMDAETARVKYLEGERQRIESRVAERTEMLNTSLTVRHLMIANASHELRTPVNRLRLLVDIAALQGNGFNSIGPDLVETASYMTQLVENILLLDPDRPLDQQPGTIENFDLGKEIRATARLVPKFSSELVIDVDSFAGLIVRGDLFNTRRILIILLSNAFKFTTNGQVSVIVSVDFNSEEQAVLCKINVRDTGIGIPALMQSEIFEWFVTSGPHGGAQGSGLGLPIASSLARNLGGSLRLVRSRENEGSEFECILTFSLTLETEAIVGEEPVERHLALPRKRQRVLLAEDDPITANAVMLIVRLLHHDVIHVATFFELREMLTDKVSGLFDFALIDYRLPGGNGLDIIKHCRVNALAKGTKFALVTADVTKELLADARDWCDAIITKPTTASHIRQLLGDGIPNGDTESDSVLSDIFDAAPLTLLHNYGASSEELNDLCKQFYGIFEDALAELNSISSASDAQIGEVIHRTQSGCATVGAIALVDELCKLGGSTATKESYSLQYSRVRETFGTTKNSINEFLNRLPHHV